MTLSDLSILTCAPFENVIPKGQLFSAFMHILPMHDESNCLEYSGFLISFPQHKKIYKIPHSTKLELNRPLVPSQLVFEDHRGRLGIIKFTFTMQLSSICNATCSIQNNQATKTDF